MRNWKPVDFIIAMFAISVAIILLVIILNVLYSGIALSDDAGDRITVIVSSILSIVSLYVGAKINENRNNKNKRDG